MKWDSISKKGVKLLGGLLIVPATAEGVISGTRNRQCLVVVTRKGIYWRENRGESAGQKQGAHTINAF